MPYPGFHSKRDQTDKPLPKQPSVQQDTAGQTETFFTRNVKLITFFICIGLFLAVLGPWSIPRIVEWVQQVRAEESQVLISESDVQAFVERGKALSWQDFEGYTYRVLIETDMYMCQYDVEGGRYYFWVTSEAKGRPIDSVLLVDTHNDYQQTEIKAYAP